jgi:hypothetical protein
MKTLMNKSKIRLAGGLAVLLMTAILAVTTAKSYATCWHDAQQGGSVGVPCGQAPNCSVNSCCGYALWCCMPPAAPSYCAQGPDLAGYGFQCCTNYAISSKVQCGYTTMIGSCTGGGCANVVVQNYPDQSYTVFGTALGVLSGGLTCQPEN